MLGPLPLIERVVSFFVLSFSFMVNIKYILKIQTLIGNESYTLIIRFLFYVLRYVNCILIIDVSIYRESSISLCVCMCVCLECVYCSKLIGWFQVFYV